MTNTIQIEAAALAASKGYAACALSSLGVFAIAAWVI